MTIAFMVARQRSGTGALGSILHKHPDITYLGEVFHPSNIDSDPYNYFRFLQGLEKINKSISDPNKYKEIFHEYIKFLRANILEKVIVIDVKYRSFHHFMSGWRGIFEAPWFLQAPHVDNTPIIHLKRNNLVETYVSGRLAEANKVWHASDSKQIKKTSIDISIEGLNGYLRSITEEVRQVDAWMKNSSKFCEIEYSQMLDDEGLLTQMEAKKLSETLGVCEFQDLSPAFVKQAPKLLKDSINNYEEVTEHLKDTKFSWMLGEKWIQNDLPEINFCNSIQPSGIKERNNISCKNIELFRRDRNGAPLAFDAHFHEFKNKNPYFGFVNCTIGTSEIALFSANDDLIAMSYFWFGKSVTQEFTLACWEQASLKAKCILDIGSFSGRYALLAAKANLDSSVHAIEPVARNYSRLITNIFANNLNGRISTYPIAISNESRPSKVNQYVESNVLGHAASLINQDQRKVHNNDELVNTITLDEFCKKNCLLPDLIRIDVEGNEVSVLEGAVETLARPGITILINFRKETAEDLYNLFRKINRGAVNYIDENNRTIREFSQETDTVGEIIWEIH